jgi:hypothetical protein
MKNKQYKEYLMLKALELGICIVAFVSLYTILYLFF